MQIKTADGAMHLVSAALLLRAYKMLPNKAEMKLELWMDLLELHLLICDYKKKAACNIRRVLLLDHCPETLDDVKEALTRAFMYLLPWDIADVVYLAIEFLSARFAKKMLKSME